LDEAARGGATVDDYGEAQLVEAARGGSEDELTHLCPIQRLRGLWGGEVAIALVTDGSVGDGGLFGLCFPLRQLRLLLRLRQHMVVGLAVAAVRDLPLQIVLRMDVWCGFTVNVRNTLSIPERKKTGNVDTRWECSSLGIQKGKAYSHAAAALNH
jgi:hypothetical protein